MYPGRRVGEPPDQVGGDAGGAWGRTVVLLTDYLEGLADYAYEFNRPSTSAFNFGRSLITIAQMTSSVTAA